MSTTYVTEGDSATPAYMNTLLNRVSGETFNVKAYGAVGDGSTDDTSAIQDAIEAADAAGGGTVVFPASSTKYIVASTLTMYPNLHFWGGGRFAPTLRFTGGSSTMFNWLGTSEAEGLDVVFENLFLESATALTGVGIRARNFSNLKLKNTLVSGFNQGVWADWGIGVFLEGATLSLCTRALQLGGGVGGIRGGVFSASPFMDLVVTENSTFSQNVLDIHDMGSENSLGVLRISGTSFFANADMAATKSKHIRVTGRNGVDISGNWIENFNAGSTAILFNAFDEDGNSRGACNGARVTVNDIRMQGGVGTIGVLDDRCVGLTIENNNFNWGNASGGYAISIQDTTTPATIGHNAYNTYSGGGYTNYITQATDFSVIMEPQVVVRGLATPNFITLPGGLVFQWGTVSFGVADGKPTWTFPKAFPNACLSAHITIAQDAADATASLIAAPSTTTAGFRLSSGVSTAVNGLGLAIGY